jgi:hypothetical protein
MEGNRRRETGFRRRQLPFTGASLPLVDHSTSDRAVNRLLADASVLVRRSSGAGFRSTRATLLPNAESAACMGGCREKGWAADRVAVWWV